MKERTLESGSPSDRSPGWKQASGLARQLWDQERPLSPDMLRAGLGLFTWIASAWAVLNVLGSLGVIFSGRPFAALVQLVGGVAIPFAVWFGVRILVDLLILQHRMTDRIARVLDARIDAVPPESGVRSAAASDPSI